MGFAALYPSYNRTLNSAEIAATLEAMTEDWTIDAELRTADIAVVLMTHGATGPLRRTHRMADPTISLFLTPDYGEPQGRYVSNNGAMQFARFGPLSIVPADITLAVRSPGTPRGA